MKITHVFPFFTLAVLAGCGTHENAQPGPTAGLTAQQNIQKIQNDPKIPDGLKKIQIDTLQRQSGIKPNTANPSAPN